MAEGGMGGIEKRVEQIQGYSEALVSGIQVMDQLRYILEPVLEHEDIKEALAEKFEKTHCSGL